MLYKSDSFWLWDGASSGTAKSIKHCNHTQQSGQYKFTPAHPFTTFSHQNTTANAKKRNGIISHLLPRSLCFGRNDHCRNTQPQKLYKFAATKPCATFLCRKTIASAKQRGGIISHPLPPCARFGTRGGVARRSGALRCYFFKGNARQKLKSVNFHCKFSGKCCPGSPGQKLAKTQSVRFS